MLGDVVKVSYCILYVVVTLLSVLTGNSYALEHDIDGVGISSLRLSGSNVFVEGSNIPTSCFNEELTASIDESQYPGGRALYASLLTARATARELVVRYDDGASIPSTVCTIVSIEFN